MFELNLVDLYDRKVCILNQS